MKTLPATWPKSDRIPPSCLKVLLVVLQAADRGESVTLGCIAARLGWRCKTGDYISGCLRRLRAAGLIAYEDGKRRTVRPACRLTMWKEYLP